MTDFAVHTPETAPEASREALAATAKAWGFVPKLHGILAESPAALKAYDALFALVDETGLSPAERQTAFLAVSVFHGCEYCTMGHTYLARQAGLGAEAIEALRAGGAPADARLGALARFTRAVVERRGEVDAAALEDFLGAGFTRANVLDVITVIATKTISNYVNHIAHTPRETFMADPALAWTAPRPAAA